MRTCGIYGIVCKADNKVLVGSSVYISRRYSEHLWCLRRGIHVNPHLQSAYKKYGEENFELKIFESCAKEELLKKEDWWINEKKSLCQDNGFNLKPAERPNHGLETCQKLSVARMGCGNPMYGKHLSEEAKKKKSDALKGEKSPFYGKHPSVETRQRMSIAQTGKKLSEETKRKISNTEKSRFSPEERKRKSDLMKGNNWNLGRKQSEETKLKRKIALKGKHKISDEGRKSLSEKRTGKNNPMYGKRPSALTLIKRAQTRMRTKLERVLLEEKNLKLAA